MNCYKYSLSQNGDQGNKKAIMDALMKPNHALPISESITESVRVFQSE